MMTGQVIIHATPLWQQALVSISAAAVGGMLGGLLGIKASRDALDRSGAFQRTARDQQNREAENSALAALGSELLINIVVVLDFDANGGLPAPLSRVALDQALPFIFSLPEDIRKSVERAHLYLVQYNALASKVAANYDRPPARLGNLVEVAHANTMAEMSKRLTELSRKASIAFREARDQLLSELPTSYSGTTSHLL
jgi:hypothetical protein